MLETVFLGKQDVEKYRMLTVIKTLPESQLNLSTIGNRLDFTYQKTYNIFQALLDDIFDINPQLRKKSSKIESIEFDQISVDEYRLFLFKNSIVFQAFDYGFTNSNPTFENFSNSHFTSKSTLNRRMSNFRKLLKNFGLKISNTTLELKGDEKNIRYLAYYVYWYTFHGLEWPFKLVQEDTVRSIVSRDDNPTYSPVTALQLEIIVAISRIRLIKHRYLDNMVGFDEAFENNKLGKEIITREDYSIVPMDKLDSENKYLNLFKDFIFLPSPYTYENRIDLTDEINPKFYDLTNKFFDELRDKYGANFRIASDSGSVKSLAYSILRVIVKYYVIAHEAPIRMGQYTRSPQDFKTLTSIYQNIYDFYSNISLEEFGGIKTSSESIAHDLYKIMINHIMAVRESDMLHIKVLVDSGNPVAGLIYHNLSALEFIKVVPNTEYENVDILITTLDVFPDYEGREKYPDDMIVIPWNSTAVRSEYIYLLVRLYRIYTEKLQKNFDENGKLH
ncbi:helix-turn-helix domain-containing protein [Companilactobacillus mishanensis]|uniref:Transcriptional regulator n=2 Tax=Companilactobacillus mishanensis TaxID=2486008 RepID=A0ABW9P923_9LACO|nr:helix-turn-helix domain-containing protein [Companilactobacillus mishanensis]MQS45719.1 transcriptional regulator [Companilactobacillus mishanensis]MQS89146.1 transcriptional regulator [Companilactobacillus mishanensis]